MAFIAMVQGSITSFLTKMSELPLTCLALEGSSPPPRHGRRRLCGLERFFRQPRFNMLLRSLAPRQLQTSNRDILGPPPNIFTPTMPPRGHQCRQRQSIPANLIPDDRSTVSPVVLEEDFCFREDAYLAFPPEVNDSTIREAIGRF